MMYPEEYCQDETARPGTSLYYSLLFLPETQRRAATAIYAYQKEIIDTVTECSDIGVAQVKLQWWREEIERLFANRPRHPVTQALADPIKCYSLPQTPFLRVIEGANRNLGQFTYPSFQTLVSYCDEIGGTISLLATEVYGYEVPLTRKYAEKSGIALHLAHILRNFRQDAARGRIYLPRDELARFKITEEDILAGNGGGEAMHALFIYQVNRIRQYFRDALADLDPCDHYSQRVGLIRIALQLATLKTMEEDGYQVLQRRVSLTPLRKLWIAWRTRRRARRGKIPLCE